MSVRQKVRRDGSVAWQYDFMHDGIRYRGLGGATKTQALRVQEKIRNQVLNGEFELVEKVGSVQFDEFAKTYLKRRQHLKYKKRDALSTRMLLAVFSKRSLKEIGPADIEDYIGIRLGQGVSNSTVNRELTCLKRMYNLAIRWNQARSNPVDKVDFLKEPPPRSRFLSEEEAAKLINCSEPYFKPVLLTALYTGMRLGEILGLTWEHVFLEDRANPRIEVTQTKNNKNRFIPMNQSLVKVIASIEKKSKDTSVFWGIRGKPLKDIRKPFASACKQAGIKNFRFHDLRHTFASYFVMKGGDLLTLKEILGHSSLDMVQRYSHLANAHKMRQMDNLDSLF